MLIVIVTPRLIEITHQNKRELLKRYPKLVPAIVQEALIHGDMHEFRTFINIDTTAFMWEGGV